MTDYVLRFGNRRLHAAKILGWETITTIDELGNLAETPISKIKVIDNTRSQIDRGAEMKALSQNIKHNGLIQPIGIIEDGKFQKKKFLPVNFSENYHRKEPSPMDVAITAKKIIDEEDLNLQETSIRLSMPESKVRSALSLLKQVPEGFKERITYNSPGRGPARSGQIASSTAVALSRILKHSNITKEEKEWAWDYVHKHQITTHELDAMKLLVSDRSLNVKQMFELLKEYKAFSPQLVISKGEIKKYRDKDKVSMTSVINKIIKGELPPNPKLVY